MAAFSNKLVICVNSPSCRSWLALDPAYPGADVTIARTANVPRGVPPIVQQISREVGAILSGKHDLQTFEMMDE